MQLLNLGKCFLLNNTQCIIMLIDNYLVNEIIILKLGVILYKTFMRFFNPLRAMGQFFFKWQFECML